MSNEVTREDIEEYIHYTKMLYDEIQRQFLSSKVVLEKTDAMDNVKDAISGALVINSVVEKVFSNTVEQLYTWLTHDCYFTGHKATFKETPISSFLTNHEIKGNE